MRLNPLNVLVFAYTLYLAITLAIDPNMFDGENALYIFMERLIPYESAWGIVSFLIAVLYAVRFFFHRVKWLSVLSSFSGGTFFILIGSAYMLTYPNIGSGIFTIIGVLLFMDIATETITKEGVKKELKERVQDDNAKN